MTPKIQRGFAIMAPDRQRAIASAGGKAAHAQHVAHEWTASEAAVAGQRGGRVSAAKQAVIRAAARRCAARDAARDAAEAAAPGREDETC